MDRREFLSTAAASVVAGGVALGALPSRAFAMGPDDRFSATLLRWSKAGWNTRTTGIRRLLQEVEKRTSILVSPSGEEDGVAIGPKMFGHPLIFMSGALGFEPWSVEEVELMRQWLKAGGTLVIDSSDGLSDGPFMRSARREMRRVYPDTPEQEVPSDHVLYKSFYLIEEPRGRLDVERELSGHVEDDRLSVILNANDFLGAWARDGFGRWEYDVVPGGQRQRELSFRMGINIVMYALCVNYKADQVHIPFILKRRKWRVDP